MQVDTSVAEADVGRLKPGMAATFTVDAYPGEVFRGKVRQIRNAPQTVQNVVTYDAVIDVDNPELKLKPGMTANVTFVYAEKDDVLKVPNAALRFRPPPSMLGDGKGGRPGAGRRRGQGRPARRGRAAAAAAPGRRGAAAVPARRPIGAPSGPSPATSPRPVKVKTGISDGTFTEVVEGELEGGRRRHHRRARRRLAPNLPEPPPRALGASAMSAAAAHPARGRHQGLPHGRRGGARAARRVARRSSRASSPPSWAPPARASPP